jgi:hypothetical protein
MTTDLFHNLIFLLFGAVTVACCSMSATAELFGVGEACSVSLSISDFFNVEEELSINSTLLLYQLTSFASQTTLD